MRTRKLISPYLLIAAIAGIVTVTHLAADAEGPVENVPVDDRASARPLEAPDDPPGEPAQPDDSARPAPPIQFGTFQSIQVNVDANGANIPGDAANEPSIAVDPTAPNRMAIGWRQFDTVTSNFRQAGWAYTNDGGRTWTFPGVLEPGMFRSDPVLDSDVDGNFYYYSLYFNQSDFFCHMFKSLDGGVTWEAPVEAFGGDKAWITVDKTGSVGEGHIYTAWSTDSNTFAPNQFTRSTDGGESWVDLIEILESPRWGTLTVDGAGDLYVSGTGCGPGNDEFCIVKSFDAKVAGDTPTFAFSAIVDMGGTIGRDGSPNPAGLMGQNWVAADTSGGPTDGNIYMLGSVDPPGSDPLDVMFARSEDGGLTWSPPVRVNDDASDTAWQWFGTMSVAPNGRIDAIWNDTRNSGQDNISELFYSFSTDAGVTWSPNVQLSPSFDSHVGWPNQNKLGDYYHMVSDRVGAHLAWAATFNNEQDVYYLRIGDYDCNGNGVGDTEDLDTGGSPDCNGNGIPDECEIADCTDCNGNGVPDECESPPPLCACDLDGVCETGEDCGTCPCDCFSGSLGCGNGVCEPSLGEDCLSCPSDCNGKQNGNPHNRFCCGDGDGQDPVGCSDSRCTSDGFDCSHQPVPETCCGDGFCEGTEDGFNCEIDCGSPPFCGDFFCDAGEDQCNCASDCGAPPASETNCSDGLDEDCDGATDCDDAECAADPACAPPSCNGDGVCDPGEDCDNCDNDCDSKTNGPPSGRYCCGNGELEGPEGDGRCDENP